DVDGQPLAIQPGTEFHWALVGVPIDPPASMRIALRATDAVGNATEQTQTYDVVRSDFPLEHVELPADFEPILDPEVRTREDAQLAAIYGQVSGPPRWRGSFVRPAPGDVTTQFGNARTYNAHQYVVHHTGTDFGSAEGEDIHAANDGVVVFTGKTDLRGNVLIIDHGGG